MAHQLIHTLVPGIDDERILGPDWPFVESSHVSRTSDFLVLFA